MPPAARARMAKGDAVTSSTLCERIVALLEEGGPPALRGEPGVREHLAACDGCLGRLLSWGEAERTAAEPPGHPEAPGGEEDTQGLRVPAPERGPAEQTAADGPSPAGPPTVGPEPTPAPTRVTLPRRVARFARAHAVAVVGSLLAALLLLGSLPALLLVARGAMAPASKHVSLSWEEEPRRYVELPAIGQPLSGPVEASSRGDNASDPLVDAGTGLDQAVYPGVAMGALEDGSIGRGGHVPSHASGSGTTSRADARAPSAGLGANQSAVSSDRSLGDMAAQSGASFYAATGGRRQREAKEGASGSPGKASPASTPSGLASAVTVVAAEPAPPPPAPGAIERHPATPLDAVIGGVADAPVHGLRGEDVDLLAAGEIDLRQARRGIAGKERGTSTMDESKPGDAPGPPAPVSTEAAGRYLAEQSATSGLRFQRASGYWANRYVPGDPALRRLQQRLARQDRGQIGLPGSSEMLLDAASRQYSQPFDRPTDSALAVFLHGDRKGIQGETRMRVQVGIQATRRGSGRRSAMNVGVVLDLREMPGPQDAAAIRSLLEALSQARSPGDTISLTVAGAPGGMVLPPGEFRYGPVSVALADLLGKAGGPSSGLGLPEALLAAATSVQAIDDPSSPLGSSLVLLVTASRLDGQARRLARIAHDSAVAGAPVSAVGVGTGVDLDLLEEVALAGQGNRRLLDSPSEARSLVDRELTAVSHVVARAVRLRIKLSPGVRLVQVLGSERLDAVQADRVREAEQSIDQRLSRSLGIEADRGEDEEGIQIVVPTWYSGDAHVVLLDVVVPGPGPVAEVTVRYKDLVFLRNGVARAGLKLGHDPGPPGPLEHNVVRNVLALDLSSVLARAASLVAKGQEGEAAASLREFAGLVRGLQAEQPALYADPEVDADLAMVGEYTALLDGGPVAPATTPAARAYVRDSLENAAFNKINPPVQAELE